MCPRQPDIPSVQLIETSAITGHFCDRSGDAYIDILSCKDFQSELAVEVVRAAFRQNTSTS